MRRILDTDEPYDRELWRGVAEMGWTGTAIPETYGGAGFGYLELCVIAEELGRSVAPIPFSSTIYLVAEALLLAGSEAQKRRGCRGSPAARSWAAWPWPRAPGRRRRAR